MKNSVKTSLTLSLALGLFGSAAWADGAGSCHFHGSKPVAQEVVVGCAQQRKAALVKSGKLEASWQDVKQEIVESVDGKKGKEWKVVFKDSGAKDKSKESLYMFFSPAGNFIGANFTGQ